MWHQLKNISDGEQALQNGRNTEETFPQKYHSMAQNVISPLTGDRPDVATYKTKLLSINLPDLDWVTPFPPSAMSRCNGENFNVHPA